jgi:hypothetical protein
MSTGPILSVVVTVVSDTSEQADTLNLEGCLESLRRQIDPPALEVLVTCDARLQGVEKLRLGFPDVSFLVVEKLRARRAGPSREHHDELRGIGIREAKAPLVALIEDHGRVDPRWSAELVKEHNQPYAAVGGAMENSINRSLNWALYFADFGRYQNPVTRGPSDHVSDANVCYKRAALERVSSSWADSYSEARVHAALAANGEVLALSPDVVVYQHRLNLRLGPALMERLVWGRSYAAQRSAIVPLSRRFVFAALCPLLPAVLFLRKLRNVLHTRRNIAAFVWASPLTVLLDIAWSCGELIGYSTGRAG